MTCMHAFAEPQNIARLYIAIAMARFTRATAMLNTVVTHCVI